MFPANNFDPQSKRWVDTVQSVVTDVETKQPFQDSELTRLRKEGQSVLDDVSSQVNAYYTATMAQYPVFQRTIPMSTVLGGSQKTVSISAPAAADSTVAETWVTVFTQDITIPSAKSVAGVRLNSAQFRVYGPAAYALRYRWRLNSTNAGIATNRWMSRHQFNLATYTMDATNPVTQNVGNQYAHWSGTATATLSLNLQASIQNISNPALAVAAQNITFEALDQNSDATYLDVMVTL